MIMLKLLSVKYHPIKSIEKVNGNFELFECD